MLGFVGLDRSGRGTTGSRLAPGAHVGTGGLIVPQRVPPARCGPMWRGEWRRSFVAWLYAILGVRRGAVDSADALAVRMKIQPPDSRLCAFRPFGLAERHGWVVPFSVRPDRGV